MEGEERERKTGGMRKERDNSEAWRRKRRRDGGREGGEGSLCAEPEIDQRQT